MARWDDEGASVRRHSERVTGGAVIAGLFATGVAASATGSTTVRLLHGAFLALGGGAVPISLLRLAGRRRRTVSSRRTQDLARQGSATRVGAAAGVARAPRA